jgi:hypothetical protein
MRGQASQDRRKGLAQIARETRDMTPTVSASLPSLEPTVSHRLALESLPALDQRRCPRFHLSPTTYGTSVSVVNADSFDAAISMPTTVFDFTPTTTAENESVILDQLKAVSASPEHLSPVTAARVAVLNMASEKNPGGGWITGASAQEEALCFRSTLAASLRRSLYPIPPRSGLHTRDVVMFRTSMGTGHELMVPGTEADKLPVVSVLSVAGIRRPAVKPEDPNTPKGRMIYADPSSRSLTKDKMRLCLRMAASHGHTMLVLGALGCGAFRNPPAEVATCWMEVLGEDEFAGGWFKKIWFAVFDRRNEGNFEVFEAALDGKEIGVKGR